MPPPPPLCYVPSLNLRRVSYEVAGRSQLDEALTAFMQMKELMQLELIIKNFTLSADQLQMIGVCVCVCISKPHLCATAYAHVCVCVRLL